MSYEVTNISDGNLIIDRVRIPRYGRATFNSVSKALGKAAKNGQITSIPPISADDAGLDTVVLQVAASVASGSVTRPEDTTAYAIGDLIANSTVAGDVVAIAIPAARTDGKAGIIRRGRVITEDTGFAGKEIKIHLYSKEPPTVANGDNGAFSSSGKNYIGSISVTLDQHFSDCEMGLGIPDIGSDIIFNTSDSANVYVLLESVVAITPASGSIITVELEVFRD